MATPFPFGSGNVLTAAQMNAITTLVTSTKTASHTLTIADVGTRVIMNSASATTITVNTSIFGASDVVEILNIGAGVCTVTAGTCTVGTSGTLALVQNAGGTLTFISASASVFRATGVAASASGLVPVVPTSVAVGSGSGSFDATTGTVTFSGASSVSLNGVFTGTYANYVIVNTVVCATGGVYGTFRVRAAGTDVSTSTYKYGQSFVNATAAGFEVGSASATNMQITTLGTTSGQIIIYINSPFLAVETGLFANAQGNTTFTAAFGLQTGSTSFDGFTFGSASSTITGKLTVFGIKQ